MDFTDEVKKRLEEESYLIHILQQTCPDMGIMNQRTTLTGIEDVGMSFEPRLKLTYRIAQGSNPLGEYQHTLVLSRDGRQVVSTIDKKFKAA